VLLGPHAQQRDARESLGEVGRQHALQRRVGLLEVAGEGGRQLELARDRLRQRIELEEVQLDDVGAEPAAPQHLRAQRPLDLLHREQAGGDE